MALVHTEARVRGRPADKADAFVIAPPPASENEGNGIAVERRGPMRPEALAPARSRLSGTLLQRLFRSIDVAVAALATLGVLSGGRGDILLAQTLSTAAPFLVGVALTAATLKWVGAYAFSPRERVSAHLAKVSAGVGMAAVVALALGELLQPEETPDIAVWAATLVVALGCVHAAAFASVRRWRRQGRLTPNIVVVGATENAARLIETALRSREAAVLGVFDDRSARRPPAVHGVPVLGDTKTLLGHRIIPYVDRIVVTVTDAGQARVRELIARLRVLPNAVTLFLDVEGEDTRAATLSRLADAPLARVAGVEADEQRAFAKRTQDLILGGLLLIAALPVLALVALAVRLDSPGPVLFRQRRHGFNNETITVLKFRSMRVETCDPLAARQVAADDDRVTRVGRFIRRTSLDELPQLFNVIAGEMSLVGPRPHAIGMKTGGELSSQLVAEYAWRHRIKPGITGWAQINGSRGPVHTAEAVRRRVALDIDYIERQSFWFDLYIILMTLPRLLGDRRAVR